MIYTDKTGTLTRNEQTVRMIYCTDGNWWKTSGSGYNPETGSITPVHEHAD